jgi:hypothetical protein
MCGRKVSASCKVVDWNRFRNMSLSRKCGSCNSYAGAEHHWTDAVQAELLRGNNNGRPGNVINELEAIRELIERHRPEFDSLLAATTVEAALQEPPGMVMSGKIGSIIGAAFYANQTEYGRRGR